MMKKKLNQDGISNLNEQNNLKRQKSDVQEKYLNEK